MKKTTTNINKKNVSFQKQTFAGNKAELKTALSELNDYIESKKIITTLKLTQQIHDLLELLTQRNYENFIIDKCQIYYNDMQQEINTIRLYNSNDIKLQGHINKFIEKYMEIKDFPKFEVGLTRRQSFSNTNTYLPSATLGINNRQIQSYPQFRISAPSDYGYTVSTDEQLTDFWRQRYPNNISLGPSLADDYAEKTDENICSRATNYLRSWFGG